MLRTIIKILCNKQTRYMRHIKRAQIHQLVLLDSPWWWWNYFRNSAKTKRLLIFLSGLQLPLMTLPYWSPCFMSRLLMSTCLWSSTESLPSSWILLDKVTRKLSWSTTRSTALLLSIHSTKHIKVGIRSSSNFTAPWERLVRLQEVMLNLRHSSLETCSSSLIRSQTQNNRNSVSIFAVALSKGFSQSNRWNSKGALLARWNSHKSYHTRLKFSQIMKSWVTTSKDQQFL